MLACEYVCTQDRNKAEGSATASSSVSGDEASGSRAAAMRQFLEHADNTNDIFIVAAQVIANTLVRARAALSAGKHLWSCLCH